MLKRFILILKEDSCEFQLHGVSKSKFPPLIMILQIAKWELFSEPYPKISIWVRKEQTYSTGGAV